MAGRTCTYWLQGFLPQVRKPLAYILLLCILHTIVRPALFTDCVIALATETGNVPIVSLPDFASEDIAIPDLPAEEESEAAEDVLETGKDSDYLPSLFFSAPFSEWFVRLPMHTLTDNRHVSVFCRNSNPPPEFSA